MAELGCDFRSTSGYVADPTGYNYASHNAFGTTYPETLANGLTLGWETVPSGIDARDRSTSGDHRLAGMNFNPSKDQNIFRIDLPNGTGSYLIRAAFGEPNYAIPTDYYEFRDTTTVLATIDHPGGHPAGQWYDASDTLQTSAANWASNNIRITKTFATTIFRTVMGKVGGTLSSAIASLSVEKAASAGYNHDSFCCIIDDALGF